MNEWRIVKVKKKILVIVQGINCKITKETSRKLEKKTKHLYKELQKEKF